MTTVTSTYEIVAAALETIVNQEFLEEQYVVKHDDIHESLGEDRTTIGIAPDDQTPRSDNRMIQETVVVVKWFGKYEARVDPTQHVDPRPITGRAERFLRACGAAEVTSSQGFWYFNVDRIEYPSDPTGNKTRFVAYIRAYSQNPSIIETTG